MKQVKMSAEKKETKRTQEIAVGSKSEPNTLLSSQNICKNNQTNNFLDS